MAGEFLPVNCQSEKTGSFTARFRCLRRSSQANHYSSTVEFLESKEGRLGEACTPKCCFLSTKLADLIVRPKFGAQIGNPRTSPAMTYHLPHLASVCHMRQSDSEARNCSSWGLSIVK